MAFQVYHLTETLPRTWKKKEKSLEQIYMQLNELISLQRIK